jgi:dipeptidyl-peptidase-4
VDNTNVAITWTNREQTKAYIQVCKFNTSATPPVANCQINFQQDVSGGWIDSPWPAPLPNLKENSSVYYTYLMDNSTAGRYKHVAQITLPDSGMGDISFLTSGNSEVQGLIAYDESTEYLYFYANSGVQRNRHLMRMQSGNESSVLCVTCPLTDCDYASAQFSPDKKFFLLSCLGPDSPRYEVMNSSLVLQRTMEDNAEFRGAIAGKSLPQRVFTQDLELPDGIMASSDIYRPPNVENDSKHPLLVYVYAGPGSLQVTSRYGFGSTISNWLRYLGSAHNIAVASVDARGTVGKGEDWKFQLYKKLATIEVDDQIAFGEKMKTMYSYINSEETAVFGWSYGGFVSSLVTGRKDQNAYKCGVAVAPVTTKRYYDTAYTERYLGLITENEAAYNQTDLFPLAPNFKDKKYFIAHGTHDDNVHFRHFATFVHALAEAEVQFRQQIYVDQDHSISSTHQSRHLFQAMTDFLTNDCFTNGYTPPPTQPPPIEHPSHANVQKSSIGIVAIALLVMLRSMFF